MCMYVLLRSHTRWDDKDSYITKIMKKNWSWT